MKHRPWAFAISGNLVHSVPVKLPRFPRAGLAAILVLAALIAGCAGIAQPEGWASPRIEDDATAFIFRERGKLSAVQLDDAGIARVLWVFPDDRIQEQKGIDLRAVYRAPEFDGERYYLAGFSGDVVALTRDGIVVWIQDKLQGEVVTGAVLADDLILVGTLEGLLYRLDPAAAGEVVGDPIKVPGEIWAPPVVLGQHVFVATMEGKVLGFDLKSGARIWGPFTTSGAIPELAPLGDDRLFVAGLDRYVYVLDAASGQPVFEPYRTEGWVWSTPVVVGDRAYFADFAGVVYQLDITNGHIEPVYDAGSKVKASLAVIDGSLIVATEDARVHFVDMETWGARNVVPIQGAGRIRANPAIFDGAAYFLTTEGRLFRADPGRLTVVEARLAGDE